MNNLILYLNITGSIPLLFYICIRKKSKDKISAEKYYFLLIISILFFILPFSLLYRTAREIFTVISPGTKLIWNNSLFNSKIYVTSKILVNSENVPLLIPRHIPLLRNCCIAIWLLGVAVCLGKMIFSYRKLRKQINTMTSDNCTISVPFLLWRRKIKVRTTSYYNAAFSTGCFHPVIVLPENMDSETRQLAALHETAHIRHWDFLLKVTVLIIRSLYWFNPLTYILFRELSNQQEFFADEWVVKRLDNRQIMKYGNAIIDSQSLVTHPKNYEYVSSFTTFSEIVTRERIIRLRNHTKKTPKKSFIIIFAIMLALTINTVVVAAYQPPVSVGGFDNKSIKENAEYYFTTTEYSESLPFYDVTEDPAYFSSSDLYFIDEHGNSIPVSPEQIAENRISRSCSHSWESGQFRSHIKNSDGSCDVITYAAKKCSNCGYISQAEEINAIHFKKCPHS
ncbi:MAG: M56 family metallopeptidase [Eubacteriales bacterium]|nr:M56 family metallopeptidase [Eubacteriales bacterium]